MKIRLSLFFSTALVLPAVAWAQQSGAVYYVGPPGIAAGGNITANTILPAWATTALTIGQVTTDGITYDIRQFGAALNGCSATPTDDHAAVAAAVSQAATDWTASGLRDTIYIPPGCLYTSAGFVFPQGVPASVIGQDPHNSMIVWSPSFTGDTYSVSQIFGGPAVLTGNTTISNLGTYAAGATFSNIQIVGNTTATGNGVMFYDAVDHPIARNNIINYIPGCAICMGIPKNTASGLAREWGLIEDNWIGVAGGGPNSYPEIGIYSTGASASNALIIQNNRMYSYADDGLLLCNYSTAQGMHDIFLSHNQVEGSYSTTAGDGIHFGSPSCTGLTYYNVHSTDDESNVVGNGHIALHIDGPSSYGTYANAPYSINIEGFASSKGGGTSPSSVGIQMDYGGAAIHIETAKIITSGNQLVCNSGVSSPFVLDAGADYVNWNVTNNCPGDIETPATSSTSTITNPTVGFASGTATLTATGTETVATVGAVTDISINESIVFTAVGTATGSLKVVLPKAYSNATTISCPTSGLLISTGTLPGSGDAVVGYLPPNGGALYFQVQRAAGGTNITAANMTAGTTYTINTTCSIF